MYVDLYIEQGSNFSSNITVTDVSTNAVINIADAIITGRGKKSYSSGNVAFDFICAKLDAANGVLNIQITSDITANVAQGRYQYLIKMTNSNVTKRIIEGQVFILPEV